MDSRATKLLDLFNHLYWEVTLKMTYKVDELIIHLPPGPNIYGDMGNVKWLS
jgi:hypothetical protein